LKREESWRDKEELDEFQSGVNDFMMLLKTNEMIKNQKISSSILKVCEKSKRIKKSRPSNVI
jgi:hypothetical protein